MKLKSRPRQNYKRQELTELSRARLAICGLSNFLYLSLPSLQIVKWTLEYLVISTYSTAMCLNCGYLSKSVWAKVPRI